MILSLRVQAQVIIKDGGGGGGGLSFANNFHIGNRFVQQYSFDDVAVWQ